MTYIEVLDTAIKIGLGALIASISAVVLSKKQHNQTLEKNKIEREFEIVVSIDAKKFIEKTKLVNGGKLQEWTVKTLLDGVKWGLNKILAKKGKAELNAKDLTYAMNTAASNVDTTKLVEKLKSTNKFKNTEALGVENQLQFAFKYTPVKDRKNHHSVEMIVYDSLKFEMDFKVLKIEAEQNMPLSPKMSLRNATK